MSQFSVAWEDLSLAAAGASAPSAQWWRLHRRKPESYDQENVSTYKGQYSQCLTMLATQLLNSAAFA